MTVPDLSEPPQNGQVSDDRKALNVLTVEVAEVAIAMKDLIRYQKAANKAGRIGDWGLAAITACFFTFLSLILFAVWIVPEIHDLKAWRDVHQNHISVLEAKQK